MFELSLDPSIILRSKVFSDRMIMIIFLNSFGHGQQSDHGKRSSDMWWCRLIQYWINQTDESHDFVPQSSNQIGQYLKKATYQKKIKSFTNNNYYYIARPAGVHYNQCVSPSVH